MGGSHSKRSHAPAAAAKSNKITDIDRSILDLKNARDKLDRYKKKIDVDSEKLFRRAKIAHEQGQRHVAVGILKLRKHKLDEVDIIHNQLLTISTMIVKIESKDREKEVIAALKNGKELLEKLHSQYSLEDIMKLMDEVHEQNELQREINDCLVRSGEESLTALQEAEIEAEYLALSQEVEQKVAQMPLAPTSSLPDVVNVQTPERVALDSNRVPVSNAVATS